MKKRKRPGSGLGILLLTAVLICSAVRPVSAEEPGEEEEKPASTPITSTYAATLSEETNNEKTISEEEQNAETNYEEEGTGDTEQKTGDTEQKTRDAEQKTTEGNVTLPSVTVDTVTWEGGLLKVPVDLGGYTADDLRLKLCFGPENKNDIRAWRYPTLEGNFAVYSPILQFRTCNESPFWLEAGIYDATMEFHSVNGAEDTIICSDSFSVSIESGSRMWFVEEKEIKFDGSQDLTFSFYRGDNYYALQSISSIEFFMWKSGFENPSIGDGFTYDMAAGTLTIDKDLVRKVLTESVQTAMQNGLENPPTRAYVNAYAVTASGEEIRFNIISKVDMNNTLSAPAWELDLTEFNWDVEELQIVPEATDYVYMKGDRGGATITCTGALEDFVSVFVDGALVDRSNYTLESGSTILTFTTKYLNTLSAGKHTVTMNYTYGSVNTELTVRERKSSGGGSGGSGGSGSGSTARPVSSDPTASVTPQEPAVSANPTETATPASAVNSSNASGSVTSVQTGDSTAFILWILAAIFASGVCGVLGWRRYSGKI